MLQQQKGQQHQGSLASTSVSSAPATVAPPAAAAAAVTVESAGSSPLSGSNSGSGFSTPNIKPPSDYSAGVAGAGGAGAEGNLLDPSKQPIYQPPPPAPTPAKPRTWAVGDRCRALYADDGKFYEATILSIGGSGQVYSVEYKGYESNPPSLVTPDNLKPFVDRSKYHSHHHQSPGVGSHRPLKSSDGFDDGTNVGGKGEQRKRGAETSVDVGIGAGTGEGVGSGAGTGERSKKKKTGVSEQVQKQMAWQSFSKGGAKKSGAGTNTGGPSGAKRSIFATPDNADGKVGVVGSGKGMTQFQQRGKHVYDSQRR